MPRQVLLTTTPAIFSTRLPSGGTANGLLRFQVQVYEMGDPGAILIKGGGLPHTAAQWLEHVTGSDKIVIQPPPHTPTAPPVEVPAALLRNLPAGALVVMEWEWRRVR